MPVRTRDGGDEVTRLSEDKAQAAVAAVLRYGSLTSTLVMALGLALILIRGLAVYPPLESPAPVRVVVARALRFDALGISELGLLLLLLTPIVRIAVAAATFALERDRKYMLISLGVLVVVVLSIVYAMG
jgi:uncharacterized membrane protein